MTKNPCDKSCKFRDASCHSTCEKYLKWLKVHEKEKEEISKYNIFYAHDYCYKYRPNVRKDSGIYKD